MIVSLRWLKQYLNFEISVDEIVEVLTFGGIEVEQTFDLGLGSGKILIGEILSVDPHPNADKLKLCRVNIGAEEPLEIVCGAPNAQAGDRVPVALEGARLPDGREIERTNIRGVESRGMLCSGAELNYGANASGLLTLPPEWKVGQPFDYLLDVSITPNRPDCLSIFGVARDLAALRGKKIFPPQKRVPETMERIEQDIRISIKDRGGCPRYCARVIHNVKVGPSPLWLARTLEAVGLRPINNIVDITNYVLMELGHPLHAFDLDKIANHEIIVRSANPGEKMQTLDGEERQLTDEDLLIATPAGPVALAGIMGGANSEISSETTNVLLESAYFDPAVIRKTAKRLDLHTDSSFRFERGMDVEQITLPLNRATQLIREIAEGEVVRGILDVSATHAGRLPITMDIPRANQILGLEISNTEIADILVLLGCEIKRSDREQLMVLPPSYRVDIEAEHDLLEEIARIYGYNKIEPTMPRLVSAAYTEDRPTHVADRIRQLFCQRGGHEVINYTFISPADIERYDLPLENPVEILNPISQEQTTMRPSLAPGFLNCIARNHNRNLFDFQLFEIGKVFWYQDAAGIEAGEEVRLIAGLSGAPPPHWRDGERKGAHGALYDFYSIKGLAECLLEDLGITPGATRRCAAAQYHPGQSAEFLDGNRQLCRFGRLHPRLAEAWGLRRDVWLLEARLDDLIERADRRIACADIGRFPAIVRDFAFIVARDTPAGDVETVMRNEAGELLEELALFDLYEGQGVPDGKKSLGFTITLRDQTKTLTDDEANAVQDAIIARLKKDLNATLRQS